MVTNTPLEDENEKKIPFAKGMINKPEAVVGSFGGRKISGNN